jgi:hypothetical protein
LLLGCGRREELRRRYVRESRLVLVLRIAGVPVRGHSFFFFPLGRGWRMVGFWESFFAFLVLDLGRVEGSWVGNSRFGVLVAVLTFCFSV